MPILGKPAEDIPDNPETDSDDSHENVTDIKIGEDKKNSLRHTNNDSRDQHREDDEVKAYQDDTALFVIGDVHVVVGKHVDVLDSVERWSEAEVSFYYQP